MLLGLIAQIDWASETLGGGRGADGAGWMVGPYAAVKITPELRFDARAAWGLSDNSVDPFGTYQDAFETSRWPLSGCSARPTRSAASCAARSRLSNLDTGRATVEPFAASKGYFGKRDGVAPDGTLIAPDVMRGRVES